ncbi:MAG: hypothetical protein WC141_00390 [Arcobacteraceae bacterium]
MNLPHQLPILFAQEILQKDEKHVKVRCVFPFSPSLGMLFEAAAQSSAAFGNSELKKGVVISVKNMILLEKTSKLECVVKLEVKAIFNNIQELFFEIYTEDESVKVAQGTITLMVEEI